jgi:hypothetical protein
VAAKTGLRVVAVCFVLGVCFGIAEALAGVAQLLPKATELQAAPGPLLPFAAFCLSVGSVVSYFILRSSWHGLRLVAALFAATYGISTVASQVESLFFLSAKLPPGLIRALFEQGAIAMALFVALAVLILDKWRRPATAVGNKEQPALTASAMTWRLGLLVLAFVFLYMFFGYYVAWRNPVLREYYGGVDFASFYQALKSNWQKEPLLFPLQVFRAVLYVACLYPMLRMLHVPRWEKAAAAAGFLASWTTILLLPNPLMPATVARSHFWETLGFNLTFGVLMGWLQGKPGPTVARVGKKSREIRPAVV